MMDMNRVMVMGRIGAVPKGLKTKGGVSLARFDVATSRRFRKEGEEGYSEETVWHRVVAWGRQGETCQAYLQKGQRVFVDGELRLRNYTGSDGQNRSVVEIHAHQVGFLDRARKGAGPGSSGGLEGTDAEGEETVKIEGSEGSLGGMEDLVH
jgi:single-strand DNA-binding protein